MTEKAALELARGSVGENPPFRSINIIATAHVDLSYYLISFLCKKCDCYEQVYFGSGSEIEQ